MKRWHQTNFFEISLPLDPRRPHCLNEKAACHIDRRRFFAQNQASQGFPKIIDNLVIDTGAAHSLLSSDVVSEIGMKSENGDKLLRSFGIGGDEYSFQKRVDQIQLGIEMGTRIRVPISSPTTLYAYSKPLYIKEQTLSICLELSVGTNHNVYKHICLSNIVPL
nr:aspartyl protease family protein [Paenibacillus chitinolyticus]